MWEAENRAPGWQAAVYGNTITLLTLMGRSIQERTASVLQAEKPDLLNEVLAYVENHLSEKITLEETARHFYVSVSTITQLFRKKMGTSFYHCVTQQRLISAKALEGRKATGYKSIHVDMEYAGAKLVDEEVAVCQDQLVTSRQPDDIPAFNRESLRVLEQYSAN